jgi:aspartyl-tRNA(Asn)/glutamyl-tRNA(Gln) amidotransferase subunit A
VAAAEGAGGRPPRLGLVEPWFLEHASDEVRAHLAEVAGRLRQAGATVEEHLALPAGEVEVAYAAHRVLVFTEAAAFHEERYRRRPDDYPPKFREMVELGFATPGVAYVQAQRARGRFAATVMAAMAGLDALLTPTVPAPAPAGLGDTGDRRFQIPWTFAGIPAISLPSGLSRTGLPLAVQLAGPLFGEAHLLRAAHWCQAALGVTLTPPDRPPGLDDREEAPP